MILLKKMKKTTVFKPIDDTDVTNKGYLDETTFE